MPNNTHINKIIYCDRTLLDMTDATALAPNIESGYSAYGADGAKINGTLVVNHIHIGSTEPSSSLGADGDIYLQI